MVNLKWNQVVSLNWNWVVNITGISTKLSYIALLPIPKHTSVKFANALEPAKESIVRKLLKLGFFGL